MPIVEAAREINKRQRERVVEKLLGELKILKGRTIGLLGLAFKPNTDDLREAPAIDIARKLVERGCKVKVHDPVAMNKFELDYPDLGVICCAFARRGSRRRGRAGAGHRVAGVSRTGLGSDGQPDARRRWCWTGAMRWIGRGWSASASAIWASRAKAWQEVRFLTVRRLSLS